MPSQTLQPIEKILPELVKPEHRERALFNWAILSRNLASQTPAKLQSEENSRGFLATVLVETAHTLAPIKEMGGHDYLVKHYWLNKDVARVLGNIVESDAIDYCGKGFIQLTGRENYERAGGALNLPLLSCPHMLLNAERSALVAAWWWNQHGLPATIAQLEKYTDDFNRERVWEDVRRKVNGGRNGLLDFYRALSFLGVK